MAGIHQSESVPKRTFRGGQPVKMPRTIITTVDYVDSIKDDLMRHFHKLTKKLSNNQCIVLARELQVAFKTMEEFCGMGDLKEKNNDQ